MTSERRQTHMVGRDNRMPTNVFMEAGEEVRYFRFENTVNGCTLLIILNAPGRCMFMKGCRYLELEYITLVYWVA